MAYYYVKDDGTAESGTATGDGGRFTTQKTGDWTTAFSATTEYYASIGDAIAASTTPDDGDLILVSDLHSKSYDNGADVSLNASGSYSGAGLQLISVDDTACEDYKPGASDTLNDTADDFLVQKNILIAGVNLGTGHYVLSAVSTGTHVTVMDCTLSPNGTSKTAWDTNYIDGVKLTWINVDVSFDNQFSKIINQAHAALDFMWCGGSLTGTAITTFTTTNFGLNGGVKIELVGVDLSNITTSLMPATIAGATDNVLFRLKNCTLNDSVTLHGTLASQQHRFEMFNTDDSSDKFYRFYIADGTGTAKNNDSVYVTTGESWYEGTDHSSIQVDTTALCSRAVPLVFEFPAQYVNLAEGTTDTLTIDLVTAETLVKHDMAAFLVYPDGTTSVQPNWVSSGPSAPGFYGIDPLDTSTAMPSSALGAGDWTGEPGTPNFYELVLDTSSDVGQATAVSVRIEVYKASIGPIYIHPLITVSAT